MNCNKKSSSSSSICVNSLAEDGGAHGVCYVTDVTNRAAAASV
jgi:hypothetical protein